MYAIAVDVLTTHGETLTVGLIPYDTLVGSYNMWLEKFIPDQKQYLGASLYRVTLH